MRISEFIRKRVQDRRTSDRKSPTAEGVKSTARYDELVISQTHDQQRFTTAIDWHQLTAAKQLSTAHVNEQSDPRCRLQIADISPPH